MARTQEAKVIYESLEGWQRALVDWLEIDLERSLDANEYQCIDWSRHERMMNVARLPLLLKLQNKKISQVRSRGDGTQH